LNRHGRKKDKYAPLYTYFSWSTNRKISRSMMTFSI